MGQISLQIPQVGQPDSTEDPKIASDLTTVQAVINGNLDASNLATGAKQLFPQLVSASTKRINFGTSTATFPGGGAGSNQKAVAHGLGSTPVAWTAIAMTAGAIPFPVMAYSGQVADSTNFYVTLTVIGASPSGGTGCDFVWIAIG